MLPTAEQELMTKLNKETAKISWEELQRFYATGAVIVVKQGNDLIDVACQFSQDDSDKVGQLLADGSIYKPTDKDAVQWNELQIVLWAVVVAPWVLVQEIKAATGK